MFFLQLLGCLLFFTLNLQAAPGYGTDAAAVRSGRKLRWDEFPCPEKDDVTVVLDQGWDLDTTFFNSDGDIVIFLDVRRYLGTEQEMRIQKKAGLLPQMARLYMPAYDVDIHGSDSGDCEPEADEVLFNGRSIGRLTGDNEIWHLHEFAIPFEQVKFPEAPGAFARNEIRIRVDIRNREPCWCTKIDWVALTFHAPRPVLMVHGLKSDGSAWNEMQDQLSSHLGIPSEAVDVDGFGSIESNAAMIRSYLNADCIYGGGGLKKYYDVSEFNIMAHSKGGLDSRYYVSERGLDAEDVRSVMQIATPNAGCYLAEKFYTRDEDGWMVRELYDKSWLAGMHACKATYDLRPKIMRIFNRAHPLSIARAGISVLAGCLPANLSGGSWLYRKKMKVFRYLAAISYGYNEKFSPGGNQWFNGDGVVSVGSAHALKNQVSGSPLVSPQANHIDITDDLALECVQHFHYPLTQVVYPKYCGAERSAASAVRKKRRAPETAAPKRDSGGIKTRNSSWTKAIQPGQAYEITKIVYLEPGKKAEIPFWISMDQQLEIMVMQAAKSIPAELLLPSGKSLTPDERTEYFLYAEDLQEDGRVPESFLFGMSGEFLYIDLPSARKGEYVLRFDGTALQKLTKLYFVARDRGPVWNLEARLRREEIAADEDFVVEARLSGTEDAALRKDGDKLTVRVKEIRKFEEEGQTFTLKDDGLGEDRTAGDGIYTAAVPGLRGNHYDFFVKARKNTAHGEDDRILSLMGSRQDSSGQILQEFREEYLDDNGNGLYDCLRLSGRVQVSAAGRYWIEGTLRCGEGGAEQQVSVELDCRNPGIHDYCLDFSGRKIFAAGADGPFILDSLVLSRNAGQAMIDLDKPEWSYHTEAKKYYMFEHAPLLFLNKGTTKEIDRDGDGFIDHLEIRTELLVAEGYQGQYVWSANLMAEDGRVVASSHASGALEAAADPASPASVTLVFPCTEIAGKHYRGPFEIQMITMDNRSAGRVEGLPCNYRTRAFSPFEFVKDVNMVDVTDKMEMGFAPWKSNRSTGTIASVITLTNRSLPVDKPLDLVFRLAIPADPDVRLARIDGQTETGTDYMDVTAEVERQLLQTGNRDYKFDAGEQVTIRVELFSRKRKIPDARIYSFWADPPAEQTMGKILPERFFLDGNQDRMIDDWEMLRGMNLWYNLRLDDADIMRLIKIWQAGSYIRNEEKGCFEPMP